jgi:ferredoxin-NADP reductase
MSLFTTLTFVEKKLENDDIYTFSFSSKNKIKQKAGQHGLFLLPGLYRPHPMSLSSSPTEQYAMFSTHTATGSAFKKKLLALQPGDKMYFVGPIMNFTFADTKSKYVFLAQGIGITPFRSMLAYSQKAYPQLDMTLIHVDSTAHTFHELTQEAATAAFYPSGTEEFQETVKQQDATKLFYLSGSPRFISATKKILVTMGVPKKNVKTDSFFGY